MRKLSEESVTCTVTVTMDAGQLARLDRLRLVLGERSRSSTLRRVLDAVEVPDEVRAPEVGRVVVA